MLLLRFPVLIGSLATYVGIASTMAVATGPASKPTPTIAMRDVTTLPASTSTTPVVFLTTQVITIAGVTNAHVTIAENTINIAIPTCIQTITPDKNGYVPPGTCGSLYRYYPSFAAAVVTSILFGILTVASITQAAIYKKKFCWVLIMGCIWETLAFTFRSISTQHQQSAGLALVSDLFVLLAPLWINAFGYMVLGRMIYFFLPSHSIFSIPASLLAVAFVTLDFVSFVIQIIGGSLAGPTSPQNQILLGIHVYMGGIGLQQFFIFIFLGLAVKFHTHMLDLERSGRLIGTGKENWRRLLFTLYASLSFISVRIMFRLIEFSGGNSSSNPLPFHEIYLYILEALPMSFAIVCFNITHPGSVLVGPESELPTLRATFRNARQGRTRDLKEDTEELAGFYVAIDGKVFANKG